MVLEKLELHLYLMVLMLMWDYQELQISLISLVFKG